MGEICWQALCEIRRIHLPHPLVNKGRALRLALYRVELFEQLCQHRLVDHVYSHLAAYILNRAAHRFAAGGLVDELHLAHLVGIAVERSGDHLTLCSTHRALPPHCRGVEHRANTLPPICVLHATHNATQRRQHTPNRRTSMCPTAQKAPELRRTPLKRSSQNSYSRHFGEKGPE